MNLGLGGSYKYKNEGWEGFINWYFNDTLIIDDNPNGILKVFDRISALAGSEGLCIVTLISFGFSVKST